MAEHRVAERCRCGALAVCHREDTYGRVTHTCLGHAPQDFRWFNHMALLVMSRGHRTRRTRK